MKHITAWTCSAIIIMYGLYLSNDVNCLWGLLAPVIASAVFETFNS